MIIGEPSKHDHRAASSVPGVPLPTRTATPPPPPSGGTAAAVGQTGVTASRGTHPGSRLSDIWLKILGDVDACVSQRRRSVSSVDRTSDEGFGSHLVGVIAQSMNIFIVNGAYVSTLQCMISGDVPYQALQTCLNPTTALFFKTRKPSEQPAAVNLTIAYSSVQ